MPCRNSGSTLAGMLRGGMLLAVLLFGGTASAQAAFSLATNFAGGTTTSVGVMMFDINVASAGVTVVRFDCHVAVLTAQTFNVYYKVGTWSGSQTTVAAWTLHDTVNTVGAGANQPTPVPLNIPLMLQSNTIYGIAIGSTTTSSRYNSYVAPHVGYTDGRISIAPGCVSTGPFTGSIANREWNGRVWYNFSGPSISTSVATLPLPATTVGVAGTPVSYTVSGSTMSDPTTITAAAGTEISLAQAAGYSPTIVISTIPAFGPTTIWSRISAAAPVGPVNGITSHASNGATTRDVTVTGNVVSLNASVANLNLGIATIGGPGAPQSFDLTAAGLFGATTVTAPAGFEVATNIAGPYGPTANIATTPAYVQSVFVRLDGVALGTYAGNVTNVSGPATVNVAVTGDVVPPDNLGATRNGPNVNLLVDNNVQGNGLLLLDFTLTTIQSAWTVTDITFTASGTADEQAALSVLALYEDNTAGGNGGVFDGPFVDLLATGTAGVSFSGPNGDYTATFSNSAWPAATIRRFFLVCKLAGKAVTGETLHVELTGVNATPSVPTGILTGIPTAFPTDAFTINTARMTVTLGGPVVFATVNNNEQGANGNGVVVCDMRLTPKNDSWTVSSLTFAESGTIDAQADINFLGLYTDNGNGLWDGPATDTLATATAGVNFNSPDGIYTAGLSAAASTFAVNQVKRFFLVAKLAGTASSGETMKVSLSGVVHASPSAGSLIGVPSGATSALVIDIPTLTVNAGPANPTTVTREKLAAGFVEAIGQFRLSASNSNFTISGITLTTSGNGSWLANLDPTLGVQLYRDSTGNGTFDANDILLCSVPGASPSVVCNFGANQTVSMNTDMDIWVVLNVAGSAGGSPAETFMASIASGAAVNSLTVGGTVKLGTLAPVTGELRVVDFSVTEFKPTIGLLAGGQSVKIEGSGFALPVTVTIGGVPCTGVADVNDTGTQITGLITPAGTGVNLAIVLTTNNLPAKTLTDTFTYSNVLPGTPGSSSSSSSGCIAAATTPLAMLALPALAALGLRRRRNR